MISSFDDNVQRLLEVAQAQYMTDQPSYKMVVYGEQYIIPMEYSDLAETVINNNTIPDYKYYK